MENVNPYLEWQEISSADFLRLLDTGKFSVVKEEYEESIEGEMSCKKITYADGDDENFNYFIRSQTVDDGLMVISTYWIAEC